MECNKPLTGEARALYTPEEPQWLVDEQRWTTPKGYMHPACICGLGYLRRRPVRVDSPHAMTKRCIHGARRA